MDEMNKTEISLEERGELEALRREKQHSEICTHAGELLAGNGLPESFASFLAADTKEETEKKVQSFIKAYEKSLPQQGVPAIPARAEAYAPSHNRGIKRV